MNRPFIIHRTSLMLISWVCCQLASAATPVAWNAIPNTQADPKTRLVQVPAAQTTVQSEAAVTIPHPEGSVVEFAVQDGAAATDFSLSGGIGESGGPCGFSKSGPGTMRVAGALSLTGYITVYDGVLDLSAAKPSSPLKINVLGDAQLIPPSGGNGVAELFHNGQKLTPGRWGPLGSADAQTTRILQATTTLPDTGVSRQEIWKRMKVGVFSHYAWNGYGMIPGMANADGTNAPSIDAFVAALDVEHFTDQLVEAGMQYLVFTAWHSGTCPLFPSTAMKKWAPNRPSCPQSDLLGKVVDSCRAKGIRILFYCHPYQPVCEPHNDWINDLFAELVERYGSRIDGLWLDENMQNCTQDSVVDYRRLMKTLKERQPDLVLIHNNGGFQTYGSDAGVQEVQWEREEGRVGSIYQIFRQTAPTPESVLITTVIQAATNSLGGGVQWSIDALGAGKDTRGGLHHQDYPIFKKFSELLKPIAASVKDTHPSTSFPPPFQGIVTRKSGLKWGVATRSWDDQREFLHVLVPPQGNQLQLPPPADGKWFANAKLLASGKSVHLSQHSRGLTLTLPAGVSWDPTNTVIVMDVVAPGGVALVNNTSRHVSYSGSGWKYQGQRNLGEFRNDAHVTAADGDSCSFAFDGTEIEWISSLGPDRGKVEVSIDGAPPEVVDLSKGKGAFKRVFVKAGLSHGAHTITLTKRGGALMSVDAFRVSELLNDHDPDVEYPQTTRYEATAAQLTGAWEGRPGCSINGSKFAFAFEGTGVAIHAGAAHGDGDLVVTLDGKPHSTTRVNMSHTGQIVVQIDGLPMGNHAVEGSFTNPSPSGFIASLHGFTVTRPDFWSYQTKRGLGEYRDDAHISERKGGQGIVTFQGSGIEAFTTRESEARTVHYTLESPGSTMWVGLNHYSPVTLPGAAVFRFPNLVPGKHRLTFTNGANPTGVNFSSVRMTFDAFRIFKAEPIGATPLSWGTNGAGGSGTWQVGKERNWHDGSIPAPWLDFGGTEYAARFAGTPGTVTLADEVRVNALCFESDGYTLRGQPLTLTGNRPAVCAAERVTATFECPLRGDEGLVKEGKGWVHLQGENDYSGDTHILAGVLSSGSSGRFGQGNLVISNGGACDLRNQRGAVADSAAIVLCPGGKIALAHGVDEVVARLTIAGQNLPPGRYSATTHPGLLFGDGAITVTPPHTKL